MKRFEAVTTLLLAIVAVFVVFSAVTSRSASSTARFTHIDARHWEEAVSLGIPIAGNPDAPVKVVVLFDLQCPVCAGFHVTIEEVGVAMGDDVEFLYVHTPLAYHPAAMGAARGAECAREQGRAAFRGWVRAAYAKQDSLGVRRWSDYARDAGLEDPERYQKCATDTRLDGPIERGRRLAERIAFEGTPTVIVGGWHYSQPPTPDDLTEAIRAVAAGDRPAR